MTSQTDQRAGWAGVPPPPLASTPPFPRRPLRQLIGEPGMSVTRLGPGHTGGVDTLLLTPSGAATPRMAVRVPATLSAEDAVEREARLLVEVRRLELGRLRGSIPRFIQLRENRDRSVLVMSALPGRPLRRAWCRRAAISHRRCRSAELAAAEAWLADFQEASRQGSGPVDMLPHGLVERLDLVTRTLGEVDVEKVTDRARGVQERLGRYDAPRTAVHGNFQAEQILVADPAVGVSGVLGWRRAATRGEPLVDVGRLAVTHAGHRSVGRPVPGAALLVGRSSLGTEARELVQTGLARLRLPEELWYPVAWAAAAAMLVDMDTQRDPPRAAALARLLARSADPVRPA